MTRQDFEYYLGRMADEERAASTAADPRVAAIHRSLSQHYAALIGYAPGMRQASAS